jgi:hypothetical protein
MVNNKDALSAAGWKNDKPESKNLRQMLDKKCFLKPNSLNYPVCDKNGNYDCKGIIASKFWADVAEIKAKKRKTRKKRPYSFKNISKKAVKLGKKLGCKKFTNNKK